jgi:hypothetical protein
MGERAKRGHDIGRWLLSVRRVVGERKGGSGAAFTWKRETGGEGGPGTAVDDRHRPVADDRGQAVCMRGAAPSRGGQALMSGPHLQFRAAVKFNSKSNSNRFKLFKL